MYCFKSNNPLNQRDNFISQKYVTQEQSTGPIINQDIGISRLHNHRNIFIPQRHVTQEHLSSCKLRDPLNKRDKLTHQKYLTQGNSTDRPTLKDNDISKSNTPQHQRDHFMHQKYVIQNHLPLHLAQDLYTLNDMLPKSRFSNFSNNSISATNSATSRPSFCTNDQTLSRPRCDQTHDEDFDTEMDRLYIFWSSKWQTRINQGKRRESDQPTRTLCESDLFEKYLHESDCQNIDHDSIESCNIHDDFDLRLANKPQRSRSLSSFTTTNRFNNFPPTRVSTPYKSEGYRPKQVKPEMNSIRPIAKHFNTRSVPDDQFMMKCKPVGQNQPIKIKYIKVNKKKIKKPPFVLNTTINRNSPSSKNKLDSSSPFESKLRNNINQFMSVMGKIQDQQEKVNPYKQIDDKIKVIERFNQLCRFYIRKPKPKSKTTTTQISKNSTSKKVSRNTRNVSKTNVAKNTNCSKKLPDGAKLDKSRKSKKSLTPDGGYGDKSLCDKTNNTCRCSDQVHVSLDRSKCSKTPSRFLTTRQAYDIGECCRLCNDNDMLTVENERLRLRLQQLRMTTFAQSTKILDSVMNYCDAKANAKSQKLHIPGDDPNFPMCSSRLCGGYTPGGWNKLRTLGLLNDDQDMLTRPAKKTKPLDCGNRICQDQPDDCSIELDSVRQGEVAGRSRSVTSLRPDQQVTRTMKGQVGGTFRPSVRLLGEMAFQLERRILDYVFSLGDGGQAKRRFYGYTVSNICYMMEKESMGTDGLSDIVGRTEMTCRLKKLLCALEKYGYDIKIHADFCQEVINRYGLLPSPPDEKTVQTFGLNDPCNISCLISRLSKRQSEVHKLNILLNCLHFLSNCDGRPLFVW